MSRVESIDMDTGYQAVQRRDRPRLQGDILQVAEEFWSRQNPNKAQKIPLEQVRERLLRTKDADDMPNGLVLQLLRQADTNRDGHITYEEFMRYAEASSKYSRSREVFSKAALSVVPRPERTAEKRTYLQEYKCCPPALFLIIASIVEIGVFVYYTIDMGVPVTASGPAPIYSPLIYNPYRRYEAWRFMSYALIHSGYMHLAMNLLMQLVLGLLLEMVHGWWRVGLIYSSGVLAGSLSHSITAPKVYVAGASGGVYAITYAHVGNLLMNWSEMQFRWVQLVVILVLTISDVGVAVWDSYFSQNPSNTGHMAHLGGALAGVLVGINILRNLKRKRWERILWWVALFVYLALVVTGIVLNATLPMPEFFPDDDYTDLAVLRDLYLTSLRSQ